LKKEELYMVNIFVIIIIIILFLASFTWECDVGEPCKPFLSVKRVDVIHKIERPKKGVKIYKDETMGYESYNHQYYRESRTGPLKRILYHNTGLKFIVETKGVGKKL
jgi:hypothetical protein